MFINRTIPNDFSLSNSLQAMLKNRIPHNGSRNDKETFAGFLGMLSLTAYDEGLPRLNSILDLSDVTSVLSANDDLVLDVAKLHCAAVFVRILVVIRKR